MSQQNVAYTTHRDGRLILPLTLGVVGILVLLAAFVIGNMAIVWVLYAIHPVWGVIAYKFMWCCGLFAISAKLMKLSRAHR